MDNRVPLAHLLIVDDEPNIVELLSVSLRFSGFAVAPRRRARGAGGRARRAGPIWCCWT